MINLRFIGSGSLGSHRSKNKLSKEYRRFPSLLIDERIIIDPSEDMFEFEESYMFTGLTSRIKDVFITHSHLGHFSISAIERLGKASGGITVYGSSVIGRELPGIPNVTFREIHSFGLVSLGDIELVALPSNHITEVRGEIAFNFLIKKERALFYGLDGGFINPAAWQIIKEVKPELYILDCAMGDKPASEGCIYHNNLDGALKIRELLINSSVATEDTRFVLSHLPSERRREIHEELTEALSDYPSVKLAYDGYYIGF